ncbi:MULTISPECIES: hypothetical protein [Mycobacteriaceae]|uniref:Uncharacterized protein n=2 Tax=Mycolicibacterium mucogenicum DSM 44124 TaxID=1226753 RepID=A0A8E4R4I8_MYCMU|nr:MULTISPECIES: hypothetical protein [Mycobacteriaceae]QPG67616.1 hypothetical protein C1S78_018955 [Mycolicibacterium mucogenicum DSM 44124]
MAKTQMSSSGGAIRMIGVGLAAGGLMLLAPAGLASADGGPLDGLGGALTNEVGFAQHFTTHNIGGLEGIAAINTGGLQAGVGSLSSGVLSGSTATSSLLNSGGNLTTFAVQGILRPGH